VSGERTATTAATTVGLVAISLDDPRARDAALTGAKAAALSRALAAGLPALPGFTITTAAAPPLVGGTAEVAHVAALEAAWRDLSANGRRPLVVRSSSVAEDGASQSMAGMFTSVLNVRDWPAFVAAVGEVVESGGSTPIAVLVQPFLDPAWGGVLFGADPVTGRSDRLVLAAVPGGPHRLVSGEVDGVQLTLSRRGRVRDGGAPPADLDARRLRQLARLARRAASTFGAPQDIEWALTHDGRIVLLQSRPITALGAAARTTGPVFGPGPVAETFGQPLRLLEEELWVTPLRDGLREALTIVGTSSARRLRRSPLVITVDGRVAADLELLGVHTRRRSPLARLDPRPPARRLEAAWRVGRLKVALPALAEDLVDDVDGDLRSLPDLRTLGDDALLRILRRSHRTLVALHGHEVLAGLLLGQQATAQTTAAAAALRELAAARGNRRLAVAGRVETDDELVARHPVLLSLVPPSIGAPIQLPAPPSSPPVPPSPAGGEAVVRETLRLRVRWVQELTARAALELGRRLVERSALATPAAVADLGLDELATLVGSGAMLRPVRREAPAAGAPLPAAFRLTDDGVVVPVATGRDDGGRGAGGGRQAGPIRIGIDAPPSPGDVLVVRTLDPALAGVLPGLGGLVAETGSVLSHLAILAREYGVPTVVGMSGAADRFTEGMWVLVDGSTGEVTPIDDEQGDAA
jgi:pyruvate,water dikinase